MAGRWAQLTTAAHIAHALDYSRPVNIVAEKAVFNALELERDLTLAQLFPVIDADGGRYELSKAWRQHLASRLMSWEYGKANVPHEPSLAERVVAFEEYQKRLKSKKN